MAIDFKIKRITSEAELNGASKVFQETWQNAYKNILPANELAKIKPNMWVNRLSRKDRRNLITVNTDNQVLGVVSYGNLRKKGQIVSDCGELMAIYVLPNFQDFGIGSELLKSAENDLVKMNFMQAALWVLKDNTVARKFYEQHGWKLNDVTQEAEILGKNVELVEYDKKLN